jgi:transposase
MSGMSVENDCVFGIDVAKNKLDIASYPTRVNLSVSNDENGFERILQRIEAFDCTLVIMESTGGLERPLARRLIDAGLDVSIVNPRQARDFAKACGQLEKTDYVDAAKLAQMGDALQLPRIDGFDEQQTRLKSLVRVRRQLIEQRTQMKNRRQQQTYSDLEALWADQIETLNKKIENVESKIDDLLRVSDDLQARIKRLETVPGVGRKTSRSLAANLPELGKLNRNEIAKLAGVAPLNHDSGKLRGTRSIQGGRPEVRQTLYMAVLSAKKWCEPIRVFYERLIERGKPNKVALIACMRKLVTILNSMMRSESNFDPQKAMPN